MIWVPFLFVALFSIIQWLISLALYKAGKIEEVPFFFLFVFRSMIAMTIIAGAAALILNFTPWGKEFM